MFVFIYNKSNYSARNLCVLFHFSFTFYCLFFIHYYFYFCNLSFISPYLFMPKLPLQKTKESEQGKKKRGDEYSAKKKINQSLQLNGNDSCCAS